MSATPDQRGGVSRVRRGGGGGRASTLSPLRGRVLNNNSPDDGKSSSMARLYQGILQLRKFKSKAKNEHLPHHHQKDNVHIQVPLRMMLSTLSIFLIFPLVLFAWRQFHPTIRADRVAESTPNKASSQVLDRFPTWMDEIKLPPLISDESNANNETSVLQEAVDLDSSASKKRADAPQESNDPVLDAPESITTSDTEVNSHASSEKETLEEESEKEIPEEESEENEEVKRIEEDEEEAEETSD